MTRHKKSRPCLTTPNETDKAQRYLSREYHNHIEHSTRKTAIGELLLFLQCYIKPDLRILYWHAFESELIHFIDLKYGRQL